jgi:hypothetical protein
MESVHQFSRGIHTLCGQEIVAGVNGTRLAADVTCPDCLKARERIEMGYRLFKLHPQPGDVVVFKLGPKAAIDQTTVEQVMALTEGVRKDYPEVTFLLLADEQAVENMTEADMNRIGWHRGKKTASKRFGFKRGMLKKK